MASSIHYGKRDDSFKRVLHDALVLSGAKSGFINLLLSQPATIQLFSFAFTSKTASTTDNYEVLEFLGDACVDHFLAWYLYKRFPELNCAKGVGILSVLKANFASSQSLAQIAQSLGFWPYISASEELRSDDKERKALLEDVFEAFIGAAALLLDQNIVEGLGYLTVYRLLETIFNTKPISLKYEDVVDAKSRLKQLFDFYQSKWKLPGSIKYTLKNRDGGIWTIDIRYTDDRGKNSSLGEATALGKVNAEKAAAEVALATLKSRGYPENVPEVYQRYCGGSLATEIELEKKTK